MYRFCFYGEGEGITGVEVVIVVVENGFIY